MKRKENKLVDYRYRNHVQRLKQKEELSHSLEDLGRHGFATTSLDKDQQELYNILDKRIQE